MNFISIKYLQYYLESDVQFNSLKNVHFQPFFPIETNGKNHGKCNFICIHYIYLNLFMYPVLEVFSEILSIFKAYFKQNLEYILQIPQKSQIWQSAQNVAKWAEKDIQHNIFPSLKNVIKMQFVPQHTLKTVKFKDLNTYFLNLMAKQLKNYENCMSYIFIAVTKWVCKGVTCHLYTDIHLRYVTLNGK